MRRLQWLLLPFIFLGAISAKTQSGTFTTYTITYQGATRQFSVYLPPKLQAAPVPMVVCLHQTVNAPATSPPLTQCKDTLGWTHYADRYGFTVVMPVSTWNSAKNGQWFWNAYNLSSLFVNQPAPDDSGFIRTVIQTIMQQPQTYGLPAIDANRIFVTGMSSGAYMTHRVGIDSSDLVAAIGPVSGMVWVDTSNLPNAAYPVSVIEYHGDTDSVVPYCGGVVAAWNVVVPSPSVDADVNYWLAQDGMPINPTPLCNGTTPSSATYVLNFKTASTEVVFVREVNYGHVYDSSLTQALWEFFSAHSNQLIKQPQ
ncbi:MAG TPA: PHB depolymerase family esterase [Candidatus Paceibacterota bacterium]|nr:PHB depolymerase family esterase [Candidatus Paceibacterota bacterium]